MIPEDSIPVKIARAFFLYRSVIRVGQWKSCTGSENQKRGRTPRACLLDLRLKLVYMEMDGIELTSSTRCARHVANSKRSYETKVPNINI